MRPTETNGPTTATVAISTEANCAKSEAISPPLESQRHKRVVHLPCICVERHEEPLLGTEHREDGQQGDIWDWGRGGSLSLFHVPTTWSRLLERSSRG